MSSLAILNLDLAPATEHWLGLVEQSLEAAGTTLSYLLRREEPSLAPSKSRWVKKKIKRKSQSWQRKRRGMDQAAES